MFNHSARLDTKSDLLTFSFPQTHIARNVYEAALPQIRWWVLGVLSDESLKYLFLLDVCVFFFYFKFLWGRKRIKTRRKV